MRERWLQTLWAKQDWRGVRLQTHSGQSIHVLHPGFWNADQGPDFLQAQLFLDQVLWVGAVEVHVRSSDWFLHQHTQDPNYQSVVLHVVWQIDPRHPALPTLELSRYYSIPQLRESVLRMGDVALLPCHRIMRPVPDWLWAEWRDDLIKQRLERKRTTNRVFDRIGLRRSLARQLGAWINRDVFESINASIPDSLLLTLRVDHLAITALYLGQAGLLAGGFQDDYPTELARVYDHIRNQYVLNPPYRQLLWMRQRPTSDPGYRLAQLAMLIHLGWDDLSFWQTDDVLDLARKIARIDVHAFWKERRNLDGVPINRKEYFSNRVVEGLLINIWAWMHPTNPGIQERWTRFCYEDNRITRLYAYLEIQDPTAADSQALLELNHQFCLHRRCGSCALASYWIQDQAPQSI